MADPPRGAAEPQHVNMDEPALPGVPESFPCLIPSFATASALVAAPYSCLVLETRRKHMALSPMFLRSKRTGIKEELDTELLKYSDRLKGVPLAYDNIRIVGQYGNIIDDSGYIHMDIEATFIVFNPKRGQTLLGKVNKLGPSHVGCLVNGCFNASIPKPNLVSVDTWRKAGPQIGTDLEFVVFQIDTDNAGVVLIRGRLDRTKVQELLAIGESSEVLFPEDEPVDTEPVSEHNQGSPGDRLPEEEADGALTQQLNGTTDGTPGGEGGKKKKNRHKVKGEKVDEAPASLAAKEHVPEMQELNVAADCTQGEEGGKQKKRKKRHKVTEEKVDEEVAASALCEQRGLEAQELNVATEGAHGEAVEKRKKTKKNKGLKEASEEIVLPVLEVHGSDSSGYVSDKPMKKRKLEAAAELAPGLNGEPETPKSKKKRKSETQK